MANEANFQTTLTNGFECDAFTRLDCLADFANGIKEVTEVQTIGEDVFGPDVRTVSERRQDAARKLRMLAQMAEELAFEFESAK